MGIEEINREIREKSLKRIDKKSPSELAASWSSDDLLYSGKGRTIFMVLPTPGCAWALSGSGGCTMCSYVADSPLKEVSYEEIMTIFNENFQKQIERRELHGPTAVKLFVSGSFLNPEEIPALARQEILKTLGEIPEIEEIVVESRPEYVTEKVIRECCEAVSGKIFEVAMGLETGDENRRMDIINKGFSNKEFEDAVTIINDLKQEYPVRSKVYLLVKPILTSEKDAIEDAVQSAEYAQDVGVDRISFCPSTIHKGTLMENLWRKGSYQPPWIWSVMEIIRRVRTSLKIPVIMDTAGFGTRRGPFNCKKCNYALKDMIIESNINQTIPEDFECECKDKWLAEVEYSGVTGSPSKLLK
ncbi:MAG TPA: archaeosine biosynthesis radical SAM protein RaSEA [Methanobacteriaceae archaeon]|nr:archaeosine biosynthesis radical SAM protein RaSEA [Methanobacteriaceae archaeon]